MNLNKIVLVGKVTEDPETKFGMEDSTSMSKFVVAVDRPQGKSGNLEQDFIPVVAWGKSADYTAEHLKQAAIVVVEGRIQVRTEEKDGQRTWLTEVIASSVKKIAAAENAVQEKAPVEQQPATSDKTPDAGSQNPFDKGNDFTEDDIPF